MRKWKIEVDWHIEAPHEVWKNLSLQLCYHSSRSPRLRKSLAEVTTNQSFDLVASPTKSERALSKGSQPRGLDRLGF